MHFYSYINFLWLYRFKGKTVNVLAKKDGDGGGLGGGVRGITSLILNHSSRWP